MNNKNSYTLKFFSASIITLMLVIGIVYLFVWNNDNKLQGKLVFSETYNNGLVIDKIELQSNDETIFIEHKNTYWVVKNRNDYYADFVLMNNLLNALNKSVYTVKFPFDQKVADEKYLNNPDKAEENSGILIRTYSKGKRGL